MFLNSLAVIFVHPIRNIWTQCALHFLVLYLLKCYQAILFGVVEQKCLSWQPLWSPFMPIWKNPSQLMKKVITYSHQNICLTGALVSSDTLFRYFLSNIYCMFLNPNYFFQFEFYLFYVCDQRNLLEFAFCFKDWPIILVTTISFCKFSAFSLKFQIFFSQKVIKFLETKYQFIDLFAAYQSVVWRLT